MRVPRVSLCLLLTCSITPAVQARALPSNPINLSVNVSHADLPTLFETRALGKRNQALIIHGLPHAWQGVFKTITSIQPPLPVGSFAYFFLQVAHTARGDSTTTRPYRKYTCGALSLEFLSASPDRQVITKEFVEAAAFWLLDAAQHGWVEFFEAWIQDPVDKQVVYMKMANVWDAWIKRWPS